MTKSDELKKEITYFDESSTKNYVEAKNIVSYNKYLKYTKFPPQY